MEPTIGEIECLLVHFAQGLGLYVKANYYLLVQNQAMFSILGTT